MLGEPDGAIGDDAKSSSLGKEPSVPGKSSNEGRSYAIGGNLGFKSSNACAILSFFVKYQIDKKPKHNPPHSLRQTAFRSFSLPKFLFNVRKT
jgi:hypothetical protein